MICGVWLLQFYASERDEQMGDVALRYEVVSDAVLLTVGTAIVPVPIIEPVSASAQASESVEALGAVEMAGVVGRACGIRCPPEDRLQTDALWGERCCLNQKMRGGVFMAHLQLKAAVQTGHSISIFRFHSSEMWSNCRRTVYARCPDTACAPES